MDGGDDVINGHRRELVELDTCQLHGAVNWWVGVVCGTSDVGNLLKKKTLKFFSCYATSVGDARSTQNVVHHFPKFGSMVILT